VVEAATAVGVEADTAEQVPVQVVDGSAGTFVEVVDVRGDEGDGGAVLSVTGPPLGERVTRGGGGGAADLGT
jgi:hypothetical protein